MDAGSPIQPGKLTAQCMGNNWLVGVEGERGYAINCEGLNVKDSQNQLNPQTLNTRLDAIFKCDSAASSAPQFDTVGLAVISG